MERVKDNMPKKLKKKPKKQFVCVESTIEFVLNNRLCRLWIDETEVKPIYDYADRNEQIVLDIKAYAERIAFSEGQRDEDTKRIIEFVSKIPRINAIQLKDKGFPEEGIMVYFTEF